MQSREGENWANLGSNTDTFIGSLVSYLVQKWDTFKFHPWNRRKEHLELVMIFLFCGSHNYVYEAQRIWDEAWCKSDKHWLHRTRRCFMLSLAWLSSHPLSPQCWSETQRAPGCCNLSFSPDVGIVPTLAGTQALACCSIDVLFTSIIFVYSPALCDNPPQTG